MPNGLDKQLELAPAGTTLLAATTILPGGGSTIALDQSTAIRHVETGNPVGLAVFISAFAAAASETYQFKIINDSNKDLNTAPVIVGDTGAMGKTDTRLTSGAFFLPIMPGSVNKEFLGASCIPADGGGTASITFAAYFMNQQEFQQYVAQPSNYV
jgi:hypothetical protein